MFNHRARNINSVLPIYTASGIYISQTFFVNGNFAFENSRAKKASAYYWSSNRGSFYSALRPR